MAINDNFACRFPCGWSCRGGTEARFSNSFPAADKLPPKSLSEDTQDDELPKVDIDEQRAPSINMGTSRESGDGVTEADPETGRVDPKGHIPAPQSSNRT
jgi:hypothetical protein